MSDIDKRISRGNCVLKFSAEWCGPCKAIAPYVKELSKEYKIDVIEIDADEYPSICQKYNVTKLPTIIFLLPNNKKSVIIGTNKDQIKNSYIEMSKQIYSNQNSDQDMYPTSSDARVK